MLVASRVPNFNIMKQETHQQLDNKEVLRVTFNLLADKGLCKNHRTGRNHMLHTRSSPAGGEKGRLQNVPCQYRTLWSVLKATLWQTNHFANIQR